MAAITPIVRTHVINVTRRDIKYGWYPPHGLFVPARKTVIIDGDPMALCSKDAFKKLLLNDLANKRVKLAIEVVAQKGVGLYDGDKTVKVKAKPVQPKPAEKPAVEEAKKEAKLNEEAIADKLDKIETGEEPVEPFSETFQDKTIEEMKPPVQDIFPPDAFDGEPPTKKADVETVDLFGAEQFGDKTEAPAEEAADTSKKGKMSEVKKAAMLAKRKATIARKKAEAEAAASDKFGTEE